MLRVYKIIALLLLSVLPAQAEKWYMQVQVDVPGCMPIPDSVHSLMVVNNTPLAQDSLPFYCLLSANELLEQDGQFHSVSLYERTLSKSQSVTDLVRLTATQVQALRRNYQADALLVLNRLVLLDEQYCICSVSNWTLYMNSDHWRAHNLTVSDTLYSTTEADATPLESVFRTAEKTCRQLFRHKELQDRYLFTNRNEDLQTGFMYFRRQEWGRAAETFRRAQTDKHVQTRAMAQADLAVALELQNKISEAHEAARQAYDDFMQSKAASSLEGAQIMNWYLNKLK